ncbi:MAG: HEAT repeat domain-containing protein [Sandaracinaceae bacterium]
MSRREAERHDAPTVPFQTAPFEPGVSRGPSRRDMTPSIAEFSGREDPTPVRPVRDRAFEPGVSRGVPRRDLTPSITEFAGREDPTPAGFRHAVARGNAAAASSHPSPLSDPRREEGQSFFAERVRAPLDALTRAASEIPPPGPTNRIEQAVHELSTVGPDEEGPLGRRVLMLGPDTLPAIARAFPGKTWVDFDRPHRPLRSSHSLSALCRALVAFKEASVPQVVRLLRSPKRDVRAAACLVAADLALGALVRPLLARLHDDEHRVRVSAMQALRASSGLPEFQELRMELYNTLVEHDKAPEARARAAKTLGQLRESEAIPRLIEELGAEAEVGRAAREALVRIVGQDRGRFRFNWRRWWRKHEQQDRRDWLIDALDQKDATARLTVANELILLTGKGWDRKEEAETREGARALQEFYRS